MATLLFADFLPKLEAPSWRPASCYSRGDGAGRKNGRCSEHGSSKKAAGEEVQRLPAGCAGMGDLAAVCSPSVRFPLVMPAQKASATTFASRPPALKPLR